MLVEMGSSAMALKALVKLHNVTVGDSALKVAFSKLLISDESWSHGATLTVSSLSTNNLTDSECGQVTRSSTDYTPTTTYASKT